MGDPLLHRDRIKPLPKPLLVADHDDAVHPPNVFFDRARCHKQALPPRPQSRAQRAVGTLPPHQRPNPEVVEPLVERRPERRIACWQQDGRSVERRRETAAITAGKVSRGEEADTAVAQGVIEARNPSRGFAG